jgi:hypothetical protein
VIRERIGGAALRAYPPAVRQARGPEMLGMLLDAGEQSRLAFVPERGSLVLGGLRERRAIAARAGTRRLIADACCQAVPIFFVLWLISALNTQGIASASWQMLVWVILLAHASRLAPAGPGLLDATAGAAGLMLTTGARRLWIMRHRPA